jgi:hypothetical protein
MSDEEILKASQYISAYDSDNTHLKYYGRWYALYTKRHPEIEYNTKIDTKIRLLVSELNKQGYTTEASCEGGGIGSHFRKAYIAFHEDNVGKKDLPKIRQIVEKFTNTPFKISYGYYAENSGGLDPDAGMYSIIFKGSFVPKRS